MTRVNGARGMEGSGAGVLVMDVSCDRAGVVLTKCESKVCRVVKASIIDIWKAPYGPRRV